MFNSFCFHLVHVHVHDSILFIFCIATSLNVHRKFTLRTLLIISCKLMEKTPNASYIVQLIDWESIDRFDV